jgi:sugar phosphate isomerase/epimerase
VGDRVSCSEYSFPSVHGYANRIGIVKLLGFNAVDISLFVDSQTDLHSRVPALVEELRSALDTYDIRGTDLFFTAGSTFVATAPNQIDPTRRATARKQFSAAVMLAAELEIPGLTILPGVPWPGDGDTGWSVCVEELRWRVEEGAREEVSIGFEPHIGAIASTPELALELVEAVPGLHVTLDASHFDVQAIPVERALTLTPYTRHVHVRASMPGAIQVRWDQNEAPLQKLVAALTATGYDGAFCVEYVPMPKWRCDEIDVVTEALSTRAALDELGIR